MPARSLKTESNLRTMKDAGLINENATEEPEPSVELSDGTTAHKRCKSEIDFLNSLGTTAQIVKRRLEGYKAGKPFEAYMNWPNGLEAPSVNSYRVLVTAYAAMDRIRGHWIMGNILPGECFPLNESLSKLLVQDLNLEETALARWYADMAQMALSYAIILWDAAHTSKAKHPDDVDMFLDIEDTGMYDEALKKEACRFRDKRNKAIGHATTHEIFGAWDNWNTNHSYQPHQDWADDWKTFQELLEHSINLCQKDIAECLVEPEPELKGYPLSRMGAGQDPIKPGVDLLNALGMPMPKGTGPRPPLQGPYPFEYDGTKWIEIKA